MPRPRRITSSGGSFWLARIMSRYIRTPGLCIGPAQRLVFVIWSMRMRMVGHVLARGFNGGPQADPSNPTPSREHCQAPIGVIPTPTVRSGGDSRGRLCAYVVKGDVSSRRSLRPSPRDGLAPRWTRQQAHFCGKKAPLAAGPSQGGKRPNGTHDLCIAQVGGRMVAFLLDHLIGGSQQRFRDSEAEGLGGLEVDDELELGRPNDRQLGRFLAIEDATGINTCLAI